MGGRRRQHDHGVRPAAHVRGALRAQGLREGKAASAGRAQGGPQGSRLHGIVRVQILSCEVMPMKAAPVVVPTAVGTLAPCREGQQYLAVAATKQKSSEKS